MPALTLVADDFERLCGGRELRLCLSLLSQLSSAVQGFDVAQVSIRSSVAFALRGLGGGAAGGRCRVQITLVADADQRLGTAVLQLPSAEQAAGWEVRWSMFRWFGYLVWC
eukprot:SAG11_NODE_1594_length_4612_cov_11.187458_8_plen_111_part_00